MISSIAEFFGTTVDFIKEHLYEYVMKYGEYTYGKYIGSAISAPFVIWAILSIIIVGVLVFSCIDDPDITIKQFLKYVFLSSLIVGIFLALCGFIWFLTNAYIPYHMSPELWSIEQAMKLIQSK